MIPRYSLISLYGDNTNPNVLYDNLERRNIVEIYLHDNPSLQQEILNSILKRLMEENIEPAPTYTSYEVDTGVDVGYNYKGEKIVKTRGGEILPYDEYKEVKSKNGLRRMIDKFK